MPILELYSPKYSLDELESKKEMLYGKSSKDFVNLVLKEVRVKVRFEIVQRSEELRDFINENWSVLRNLEYACITSRYLPEDFRKEEVPGALKVYEKLRELLWNS